MLMKNRIRLLLAACIYLSATVIAITPATPAAAQSVDKVTEVEGISEYSLENGARVLLYPDSSAGTVTVAMTVLVGSRHEGYGETGMAHLLEHMLFKGSPKHQDIPKEMKDRGATFNGTTWYDRTNYYETVPASEENLEWALDLEADRLVNSFVRGEDLRSEMTVVRNEFEIGENNPDQILFQRIMANAYEWHNYGKSPIGNRIDLERVPITSLRRFYQKYYQPDNIILVVAGKFDSAKALELIKDKFGSIPRPSGNWIRPTPKSRLKMASGRWSSAESVTSRWSVSVITFPPRPTRITPPARFSARYWAMNQAAFFTRTWWKRNSPRRYR